MFFAPTEYSQQCSDIKIEMSVTCNMGRAVPTSRTLPNKQMADDRSIKIKTRTACLGMKGLKKKGSLVIFDCVLIEIKLA